MVVEILPKRTILSCLLLKRKDAAKSLHYCSLVACSVSQFSVLAVFLAFDFSVGAVRQCLLTGIPTEDVVALFAISVCIRGGTQFSLAIIIRSFDGNGGASFDGDGEEPLLSDGKLAMVSGSPCMSTSALFGCYYYDGVYSSSKSSGSLVKGCECGCFTTYCIYFCESS